jgi:hypothetical protein
MHRSYRLLASLGVGAVALAGCNGLLGIKEGEPLEDAATSSDAGDSGSIDTSLADADADADLGDTTPGDANLGDAHFGDTTPADGNLGDTTPGDSGATDSLVADSSPADAGVDTAMAVDAACNELAAYPPAKPCPSFAWACWPIAPDGPGAANYTVKTICGDNVVIDKTTGLMWAQAEETGSFNAAQAKVQCVVSRRAGFSDWRLPTRIELSSLVDRSRLVPPTIEPTAFPSAGSGAFWSSSLYAPSTNNGWYVGFTHGYTNYAATSILYGARCVR